MKKSLAIAFSASLVLVLGLSVFLWLSWQNTEGEIQTGIEAIENLIQVNQDLNGDISALEAEIAESTETIQSLRLELDQLASNRTALHERAGLYQSQKTYLVEVLNWYNQNYFFQETSGLVSVFAAATGNIEP